MNEDNFLPARPMAPQPTNPSHNPPATTNTDGIQLPKFPASRAAQPTNLGQSPPPHKIQNQKTWQAPRIHAGEAFSEVTKSLMSDDFRKPLKRVGLALGALFLTIWLLSMIYNAIAGLFQHSPTAPSAFSTPAASPVVSPGTTAATSIPAKNNCTGVSVKMKTANISTKQVDRLFWQKHPEHLNKALDLSIATERALGQEWCQIAGDLATPKP
jgi:hypothetical protein